MKKRQRRTLFQRAIGKVAEFGNMVNPRQHPDDRKLQIESHKYAQKHGAAFVREHRDTIAAMVTVYADKAAEDLLEMLREHFWSGDWERRRRQRRTTSDPTSEGP